MTDYDNEEEFIKLANDMEANPDKYPGDPYVFRQVVSNLRNEEYHDFFNQKFAVPKLQMIADFEALGRPDIVARVKNGDFDQ